VRRLQNEYFRVYLLPGALADGRAHAFLGCSCPDFCNRTARLLDKLAISRNLALHSKAFVEEVYCGRPPCALMRLVLRTLCSLVGLAEVGDALTLEAVPVLPWPRDLAWTGPPRGPVRLPFGRSPDVTTRVYSVVDGSVRALVKSMSGGARLSCARLQGLDQCSSSATCRHKQLLRADLLDGQERPDAEVERAEPKEEALLALLQAGGPIFVRVWACCLAAFVVDLN
jgi:hypothetical protein